MRSRLTKNRYFGNRPASEDLDYFLSEQQLGGSYEVVRNELQSLIADVARDMGFDRSWANDEVRHFLGLLANPQNLIERSKRQNIVLYQDQNLVVYAALFEWSLVRKLKRLGMVGQTPRNEDWNDCVAMCKVLYDQSQAPLELSIFSQFDDTDREPPVTEKTLSNLRRLFIHLKKIDPLPSLAPHVSTGGASSRSAVTQQPNRYWAWSGQQQRWAYIVTGQGPRPESEWPQASGTQMVYHTDDGTWKWHAFNGAL